VGLALGGLPGSLLAFVAAYGWHRRRRPIPVESDLRLFLLLMQIELRSGQSVLGALREVSALIPDDTELRRAARMATVAGLGAAQASQHGPLRGVLAQLGRAQRSGSSLEGTLTRLLDQQLAEERAHRLARARALPVKLMIPLTMVMLPGLVLLLYAPSLLGTIRDLAGL
jgi:pilus assembly protein TadC